LEAEQKENYLTPNKLPCLANKNLKPILITATLNEKRANDEEHPPI